MKPSSQDSQSPTPEAPGAPLVEDPAGQLAHVLGPPTYFPALQMEHNSEPAAEM